MIMKLTNVVPFGRSLDEYINMFSLSTTDLNKTILGVADGPASFNVEMNTSGRTVVSVDPLYCFAGEDIEKRFYAVIDDIISQIKMTPEDWVWSYHLSPEHLKENRIAVLHRFLMDYNQSKGEERYLVGELPKLDFGDRQFQLALCSHFLFLYSDHLTYEFHRDSVLEMLRVAEEVRIFPLLTLMLERSPYLHRLIAELNAHGYTVSVEQVRYELQKGGNEMLRISRATIT